MNAKVFINYRREDSAHAAGRLYDRLIAHFGEDQVFIDIDQIEPGEDFVEAINRKVSACDIAIVAIGPNWLRAIDASGKRRLDDEEDFVRMEIVAALQRQIRVIPVLVGGARMPGRHDLPEALAPLSRRNAIELSETRFHADVNRLIEAIEKSFAVAEKKAEAEAARLAEEKRQAAQLAELKLAEEKKAAEAEAARLADEKRKLEEAARAAAEKRNAAEAAERARLANEQRRRQDRPYCESERSQQGSVATAKDSTTPVKSAQAPPAASPPVPAAVQAAQQYPMFERNQQGNLATAKDSTAPVKSTQATPGPRPLPSTSLIATLKVWTSEHRILVCTIAPIVLCLLALAGFLIGKAVINRANLAGLQKYADQGDANFQFFVASIYERGEWGVPKDLRKAAEYYQKAADQGDAFAQWRLARLYGSGEGVKDLGKAIKAVESLQKSADQGNAKAQYFLAHVYEQGLGIGIPKDLGKARELYQKAADQGDEAAIARLKALPGH